MPIQIGPEQRVNSTVTGGQFYPAVTTLQDGGWVVAWHSDHTGMGKDVFLQRYSADGSLRGTEVKANTFTGNDQSAPSIAGLRGPFEGWVVGWTSDGQVDGTDVFMQQFGKEGATAFQEKQVNSQTVGFQSASSIAALPDGRWVVAWQSQGGLDPTAIDVSQRIFDQAGTPQSAEAAVNLFTDSAQRNPSIAVLTDGRFVVTWESPNQAPDNSGFGVFQRLFDGAGNPLSGEIQVNSVTLLHQQESAVVGLKDGGWVVTWQSLGQDAPGGDGIYQQRYDRLGNVVGGETLVNTTVAGDQRAPAMAALADGGWVVTWSSSSQDGSGTGVYQQRFGASGSRVGGEFLVNTFTQGGQEMPTVSSLADGGWVVAWHSADQEAANPGDPGDGTSGIYQRRFSAAPPVLSLTGTMAKELGANGAVVGTLPVAGPLDALTYSLGNDAGGRFSLSGDQLVVKNGLLLDHEQARSHTVTINVTDAAGLTAAATFTIDVANVTPERTAGSAAANTIFGGTGADKIYGGLGNDLLKGGSNIDILKGDGGNDRLFGGAGKDTLTGGSGRDIFVFDTKPTSSSIDRVTDFNVRDDSFWFDNAVFTKIGKGTPQKPLKLKVDAFFKGAKADDPQDRVIYDPRSGKLFYDQDGEGGKGQVLVAQLNKNLKMTYGDFYVI